VTRILHVSDIHFGWPAVLEQADAVEAIGREESFDVIAVSGDLAQRARAGEFQRAAVFLRDIRRPAQPAQPPPSLIVVPGNHDVAWWFAPLGIGQRWRVYEKYRRYISKDLEPELHTPGVTFAGLNTAAGVDWHTLTWNPRDLSVKGGLRRSQLRHAADVFTRSPAGDRRVIVMHHNPMRGELSGRHGLLRSQAVLEAFGRMGVDLVLCGHDHQEAVAFVEESQRGFVVSTAGTISSRSRGGRPAAINVVTISASAIEVETRTWRSESRRFEREATRCFTR
jgi:3',5'-cyclic AMP phosphodiesterase CpdA